MPNKLSSLCLAALLPAMLYAQNTIQINTKGIPEFGLNLTIAADSGLNPGSDLTLQTLWPYTVVLSNSSDRPLISYVVSWSYVFPNGQVRNHMTSFVRPLGFKDGDKSRAARTTTIVGSSRKLLTPMLDISPSSPVDLSRLLVRARTLDNDLRTAQTITVALDAAVFEDGTLVGPDTRNFTTRLSAQLNAEQDLYQDVLKSISDADLTNLIQSISSTKRPGVDITQRTATYQSLYSYFRAQAVAELASINSHSGLAGVRKSATVKSYKQRPSIKKQQ